MASSSSSSSSGGADGNGNGNNNNNLGNTTSSGGSFKRPIRRGTIENWDSMTTAWRYVLHHELGLDPEAPEYPVVLTDSPKANPKDREKMTEIMFETFNVPGLYVGSQAVFSLYASGRTRGLVVECGDGVTHSVPVFEGFALPHATSRLDLAGSDLTSMVRSMLAERGVAFSRSEAQSNIVRSIKESLCQVSLAYEEEVRDAESQHYELPDGQVISVDPHTTFGVPEALFTPSLFPGAKANGIDHGIADMVMESISKSDGDLQPDLFSNIVLSGGSSMFPGLRARMAQEIMSRVGEDSGVDVNVITDSQRKFASWIGGSMFGSLGTFGQIQLGRQEYNDSGASRSAAIHRKCF
jgi:actin-related protein